MHLIYFLIIYFIRIFFLKHAGKITVKDCIRLTEKNLFNLDKLKMPYFINDM